MQHITSSRTLADAQQQGIAPWSGEVIECSSYWVAVFRDSYPVTPGHLLCVPRYDHPVAINHALEQAYILGSQLQAQGRIQGFNVGMNIGAVAGQTVMYPHVHMIPRSAGDCEDPVGGVRGVIPGQANYRTNSYHKPICS